MEDSTLYFDNFSISFKKIMFFTESKTWNCVFFSVVSLMVTHRKQLFFIENKYFFKWSNFLLHYFFHFESAEQHPTLHLLDISSTYLLTYLDLKCFN